MSDIEYGYKKKFAAQLAEIPDNEFTQYDFKLLNGVRRFIPKSNPEKNRQAQERFEEQIQNADVLLYALFQVIARELHLMFPEPEYDEDEDVNDVDWEKEVDPADLEPHSVIYDLMAIDHELPIVPLIDNLLKALSQMVPSEERVKRVSVVLELGKKMAQAFRYPDNPTYQAQQAA